MGKAKAKAKHTPGPWSIKWTSNIFGIRTDTGHEGIVANAGGHSANFVNCSVENEANARLIAATPDLLAACKAFIACPPKDRHDLALEQIIEAAIARAESESV